MVPGRALVWPASGLYFAGMAVVVAGGRWCVGVKCNSQFNGVGYGCSGLPRFNAPVFANM